MITAPPSVSLSSVHRRTGGQVEKSLVEASLVHRPVLVRLLAQGHTDASIARRLQVSERTVRRRVAELLLELGASSRFQAGVLLAKADRTRPSMTTEPS
jgi:DNA-binding NarL/FixJ family response regulator